MLTKSRGSKNTSNVEDTGNSLKAGKETRVEMLSAIVEILVSEKRIQFRDQGNIEIELDINESYGAFANINTIDLKRVLSNSINNSVEAFESSDVGKIILSVLCCENGAIIKISDNGKGIPKDILKKLGQEKVSFGKDTNSDSGNGLGVHHAKKTIESFGGKYRIESNLGSGTTVTMSFCDVQTPSWFVNELKLEEGQSIVICDDDNSIHSLWDNRLKSFIDSKYNIKVVHLTSNSSFSKWMESYDLSDKVIFLMDYEFLGGTKTGLDLIEQFSIEKKTILVTSRYDEEVIMKRSEKNGVKLIPKGMAGFVKINIIRKPIKYDLCLIDDDELIRQIWQISANKMNMNILIYDNELDFLNNAINIDKETPIYVDVHLKNGVLGQDVAKELYELKFTNINLATGYERDQIDIPHFINDVIGKKYPL